MFKSLIIIAVILLFGVIVMYNKKVLDLIGLTKHRSEGFFYKYVGKHIRRWNVRVERTTNIKKGSLTYKVNAYLKEIITNLDMAKDNVTPVGLLTFITTISLAVSILFLAWSGEFMLSVPAFCAIFYLVLVIFKFMSLIAFEKKEAEIMDTEDLIAMDIKGGVFNAILRYRKSLHPNMKPYFEEFIDNVKHKGYGFRAAMLLLNERLGHTFTDFAQKAILYEEKADDDMDDIFSSVVEVNRHKRQLRYENNQKFNQLRLEFLISIGVIAIYGVFSIFSDPFLANFFKNTFFGKVLLIADVVLVTGILAYIASIKTKL